MVQGTDFANDCCVVWHDSTLAYIQYIVALLSVVCETIRIHTPRLDFISSPNSPGSPGTIEATVPCNEKSIHGRPPSPSLLVLEALCTGIENTETAVL